MSNSDDNFKEITSVIRNYTNEKKTDYAILLNGDWGCGKTYFIENILQEEFKKDTEKKLVYISAAGIKDTTEFINGIYFKLLFKGVDEKKLDIAKKSGKSIAKALKTFIPSDSIKYLIESGSAILPNILKDRVKFSNTLIVIDDLERISETIKTEDFLYRIYDTFVSQNVKVLFVANETEIYKNTAKSKYADIKEKVIRHTLALHTLENKSFEKIINNITQKKLTDTEYIEKYFIDKTFFDEHISDIKKFFIEKNYFNLRTYITYLDLAKKILPIDERLKEHREILKEILNTLCCTLIEFNSDEKELFINMEQPEKKEDQMLYKKMLPRTYNFKTYANIPILKQHVETGYLNAEQIIKNYEHILSNGEEYDNAYDTLRNENVNDGKDVKKAIGVVISKIKEKPESFNVENLVQTFSYLKKVDYLLSKKQRNIFNDITDSIKDSILKSKNFDVNSFFPDLLPEDHELYDMIQKTITEASTHIKEDDKARILIAINESNKLQQFFYSMDEQYAKMICEPQFLEQITVRPFAIALFTRIINDKKLFENNEQSFENLVNYINGLPTYPNDKHLQAKIDLFKEKINNINDFIARDTH